MSGIDCGRNMRCKLVAIVWSATALATAETASAQVPGGCNTPASQRTNEIGCYLSGTVLLVLHDASHPWVHPATDWRKARVPSRFRSHRDPVFHRLNRTSLPGALIRSSQRILLSPRPARAR